MVVCNTNHVYSSKSASKEWFAEQNSTTFDSTAEDKKAKRKKT